jgi:hypothetical protein
MLRARADKAILSEYKPLIAFQARAYLSSIKGLVKSSMKIREQDFEVMDEIKCCIERCDKVDRRVIEALYKNKETDIFTKK